MWRIIENTEGKYSISDQGEVKNNKRGNILKYDLNIKGYRRVKICARRNYIHRLVAIHFIPNPENKPQVNHIDGNKLNNTVCNLEWCTDEENQAHAIRMGLRNDPFVPGEAHPNAKLTNEKVLSIRRMYKEGVRQQDIADRFGIALITAHMIIRRKLWKHI